MSFKHSELQEIPWNNMVEMTWYNSLSKEDKILYLESWGNLKEGRKNNHFYKQILNNLQNENLASKD